MEDTNMKSNHQYQLWVLVILIAILAFWTKPAKASNEYLNSGGGHCQSATLSPYIEYNKGSGTGGNADNGGGSGSQFNNSDGLRFGLQLQIPLGSTCTKKYKRTMLQNELLKQQLEMLKLCARYKELELGDEFADVRRMCKDVRKKPTPVE
jgi:hypothetical protein